MADKLAKLQRESLALHDKHSAQLATYKAACSRLMQARRNHQGDPRNRLLKHAYEDAQTVANKHLGRLDKLEDQIAKNQNKIKAEQARLGKGK